MRTISSTILIALGFALFLSIPVLASENPCPPKTIGTHNSGQYHFGFQSWTRELKPTHEICHCLRNYNSARGMFFDWERTGLKGFVLSEAYACIPSFQPIALSKDVPLWYGTSPLRKDVPTILPQAHDSESKQNRVLNHQVSFSSRTRLIQVAAYSTSDRTDARNKIVSRSKISVPLENRDWLPLPKGSDLILYAEVNPEILQELKMEFSSTPSIDPQTGNVLHIEHICRWMAGGDSQIGTNWKGYQLLMRFENPELQKRMFKSSEPKYVEAFLGKLSSFHEKEVLSNNGAITNNLIKKTTTLQIIAPTSSEVIGTMPISYYAGD